jgi:predicted proteasome-type protease
MNEGQIQHNIKKIYEVYFQDGTIDYKVSTLHTSNLLYFYEKYHEPIIEQNYKVMTLQEVINNGWKK